MKEEFNKEIKTLMDKQILERENSVSLIKRRCTVGNLTNKLDQEVDSILKTKCKRISNFPTKNRE